MCNYVIDLQSVYTEVVNFLNRNRHLIKMYNSEDGERRSIESVRLESINSNDAILKDNYLSDITESIEALTTAIVCTALYNNFNSIPESYNSVFSDTIMNMMLPSKGVLDEIYCDYDICASKYYDSAVSIDDALALFDDLYLLGLDLLNGYDFDKNRIVNFNIKREVLHLTLGMDFRIAVFEHIFKDGYRGPSLNCDGSLPDDIDYQERSYIKCLQDAAKM